MDVSIVFEAQLSCQQQSLKAEDTDITDVS